MFVFAKAVPNRVENWHSHDQAAFAAFRTQFHCVEGKKNKPRKLAFPGFDLTCYRVDIDAVGAALEEIKVIYA